MADLLRNRVGRGRIEAAAALRGLGTAEHYSAGALAERLSVRGVGMSLALQFPDVGLP